MANAPTKPVKISKDLHRQLCAIQRQAKHAKRRVPDLSEMVNEALINSMSKLVATFTRPNGI